MVFGAVGGGPGLQAIVLILWAVLIEERVVPLVRVLRHDPPTLLLVGRPRVWRQHVLRDLWGFQRGRTPLRVVALRSYPIVLSSYIDSSKAQDSCTQPASAGQGSSGWKLAWVIILTLECHPIMIVHNIASWGYVEQLSIQLVLAGRP